MGSLILPHCQDRVAFDALADTYDAIFTESHIGKAQRAQVWAEMDRIFQPGQRILEINCGTGVDALHLAQRGVKVMTCDVSPWMVAVARERVERAGLLDSVAVRVLATEDVGELQSEAPFDGALSNFSGLNCVEDITAVARRLAGLLRPGAKALLCVFGRWCLWEMLWYAAHANFGKTFRRIRPAAARTCLGLVHYPSVVEIEQRFAPYFHLLRRRGIGVAVPPSYLEPWVRGFPSALQLAAKADSWLGRIAGIRDLADHVLLTFERSVS